MCGICGFYSIKPGGEALSTLDRMASTLVHRGPDGTGMWLAVDQTAGLANTRLAVIDIVGGKQPMESADGRYVLAFNGRYVLAFNGEIYNFKSIRSELESNGYRFRTRSDTEVILVAYQCWGSAFLDRLHGMFALALYDNETGELFLARDRTGIKPLYYHAGPNGVYFGSELKSILSVAEVPRRLNFEALADFFVLSYPVLPKTFFRDIHEVEPGSWLKAGKHGIETGRFWQWQRDPTDLDSSAAVADAEAAIAISLEEHLVSDVPVGAFLSGGIDSSVLVAMLVKVLGKKEIDTFNVAFGESSYDESAYARAVSKHLGTRHHEIVVDSSCPDIAMVDEILLQFDQPFGDSSAIPTFLMCRETRKFVKVCIGGDGGDEMFGGYPRFRHADMARRVGVLPGWCITGLRGAMGGVQRFAPNTYRKSQRFLRAARLRDEGRLLALSAYLWPEDLSAVLAPGACQSVGDYSPALSPTAVGMKDPGGPQFIDSTIKYALPGDYLRKVDMMSSAHGLEVRVPYLGESVLEFAAQIPDDMKYSVRTNKILLRKIAAKYLPSSILQTPKRGFGIPLDSWLGPAGRGEVAAMLGSPGARIRDLVSPAYVSVLLSQFVNHVWDPAKRSRFNLYQQVYFLWSLEKWLERWNPQIR